MTDLHIPDEAVCEFDRAIMDDRTAQALDVRVPFTGEQYVDAIARPVLVAWLRDLLGDYPATFEGVGAAVLRRKLDEMEAGRDA